MDFWIYLVLVNAELILTQKFQNLSLYSLGIFFGNSLQYFPQRILI